MQRLEDYAPGRVQWRELLVQQGTLQVEAAGRKDGVMGQGSSFSELSGAEEPRSVPQMLGVWWCCELNNIWVQKGLPLRFQQSQNFSFHMYKMGTSLG